MNFMPSPREHIEWESGAMSPSAEADFFQKLIDGEVLETLSVRYQNRAKELLDTEVIFT